MNLSFEIAFFFLLLLPFGKSSGQAPERNKEKETTETNYNFFFHTKTNSNLGLKKLQFALSVDAQRTVIYTVGKKNWNGIKIDS